MKKLSLIIALLGLTLSSMAQEKKEKRADKFNDLKTELNLTEAQEVKVKALMDKRRAENQQMKEERLMSQEEMKQKRMENMKARKEANEAFEAELKEILTEEQLKVYEQKRQEREKARKMMKERRHKKPSHQEQHEHGIEHKH